MHALLAFIARRTAWFMLMFLLVVIALAAYNKLPSKLRAAGVEARNLQRVANQLSTTSAAFEQQAQAAINSLAIEATEIRKASPAKLDDLAAEIEQRQVAAKNRVLDPSERFGYAVQGNAAPIVSSYRAEQLEIPLARHALQLIDVRRRTLERQSAIAQRTDFHRDVLLHRKQVTSHNRLVERRNNLMQQAQTERRNAICRQAAVALICPKVRAAQTLADTLRIERTELDNDRRTLEVRARALKAVRGAKVFVSDVSNIVQRATSAFATAAQELTNAAGDQTWNTARDWLRTYGVAAAWIVLSATFSPLLWKLFSFVVIAPFVARAQPIQLSAQGQPLATSTSHGALTIAIDRDTELLLRSQAQSAAADLRGKDVRVLSGRMFFTCLAAGLVNLQRLSSDRANDVSVTAIADGFEVALLDVPAGGAVVLHPRALVGVRLRRGTTLRVTRPWLLGSLASWLKLRFRLIVFHGPCGLIVQGRRGVQVDYAGPAPGRMINDRLLLGFETNLDFGAARSASFMPYLRGEASLFNDRFSGDGCFVYEQRPSIARRGLIWGRGLGGLRDAVLKAFGI